MTVAPSFTETSLDAALAGAGDITAASAGVLSLFHSVVRDVPAYRAFLQQQGIAASGIRTLDDFAHLPLLTKQNYLYQHELKELCRNGALESCDMIAVSSGSTGQPTFWPRSVADELPIARRFEQVFFDKIVFALAGVSCVLMFVVTYLLRLVRLFRP